MAHEKEALFAKRSFASIGTGPFPSNYRRGLEKQVGEFAEAWRDLDSVQRREFVVVAHRDKLRQVGYL
jgi:hypothetical protein